MKKLETIISIAVPIAFALIWLITDQWTVRVLSGLMAVVVVTLFVIKQFKDK